MVDKVLLRELEENLNRLIEKIINVFEYDVPIRRHYNSYDLNQETQIFPRRKALEILNKQNNTVIQAEIMYSYLIQNERVLPELRGYFDQVSLIFNQIKTLLRSEKTKEEIVGDVVVEEPIEPNNVGNMENESVDEDDLPGFDEE